jgi:hypothetical protein
MRSQARRALALAWMSFVGCGGGGRSGDAGADAGPSPQDGSRDLSDRDSPAADRESGIDALADTLPSSPDSSGSPDRTADTVPPDGAAGGGPCTARTGGALVTIRACGQSFSVWITNPAFIDEAIGRKGAGRGRIPVLTLRDGGDCDAQWSWHVAPEQASFADFTIELCDGCPAFVESQSEYWLTKVKSYCPWTGEVVDVRDYR